MANHPTSKYVKAVTRHKKYTADDSENRKSKNNLKTSNMKITIYLFFLIMILTFTNSCERENTFLPAVDQENLKGFWEEKISKKEFIDNYWNNATSTEDSIIKNLPSTILHSLVIEENQIVEYMTFKENNYTPISKFPIRIAGNKVTVLHPNGSGDIVSEIYLTKDLQLSHNKSFVHKNSQFPVKATKMSTQTKARSAVEGAETQLAASLPGLGACIELCKATHRALGVPRFLDSICCFWWPDRIATLN